MNKINAIGAEGQAEQKLLEPLSRMKIGEGGLEEQKHGGGHSQNSRRRNIVKQTAYRFHGTGVTDGQLCGQKESGDSGDVYCDTLLTLE